MSTLRLALTWCHLDVAVQLLVHSSGCHLRQHDANLKCADAMTDTVDVWFLFGRNFLASSSTPLLRRLPFSDQLLIRDFKDLRENPSVSRGVA